MNFLYIAPSYLTMYQRVIVPTDGSRCAQAGVREGLEFARRLGLPVVALYVIDVKEYEGLHHHSIKDSARTGFKQTGTKTLIKLKEYASTKGVEIKTEIKEGIPYKVITDMANGDDIIYISSHGASGFTKFFLGSTTDKVLKNARCTVAVVKGSYCKDE